MHMPAWRLIKYCRKARCIKNTKMRPRRKDVEVASQCTDMEFNLI